MKFLIFITLFSFSASAFAERQCFELFNIYKTVKGEKEFIVKLRSRFAFFDKSNDLKFEAEIDKNGVVSLDVELVDKDRGIRSHMHGGQLYAQMIQHFGLENIKAISGVWSGGTNFEQFYSNLRNQMSVEKAAFSTWSGRQAARYGFTKIASYEFIKVQESEYGDIPYPAHKRPFTVIFTRP